MLLINLIKGDFPMFIAALSTIAKSWKEPRCPSTDDWIKKMWSEVKMAEE